MYFDVDARHQMTEEEFDAYIEDEYAKLYEAVYALNLDNFEIDLDYDLYLKYTILMYKHPDSLTWGQYTATSIREERRTKQIKDALAILEKYETPEYHALKNAGFYNPFVPREGQNLLTPKAADQAYRRNYIAKLVDLSIPAYIAERILKNLEAL